MSFGTAVNRTLAARAEHVLGDDPAYSWLEGRRVVLAELGRIRDHDFLRGVAGDLCQRRVKTHEALIEIRRRRRVVRGRRVPRDPVAALALEVRRLVQRRREAWALSTEQVDAALNEARPSGWR